ncbi:putative TfdA family taurine dioxygenase [Rhodotorula diobovata]|uniref:Putative TfdA family taurine dioxygenase n=1 Tax=Rhodotorula diobovata TaxID=5288 RepID=A0A5C5G190_9BASI|nr:putative TfdA family taurine dioxygenase [Rhodotorula diobovata]
MHKLALSGSGYHLPVSPPPTAPGSPDPSRASSRTRRERYAPPSSHYLDEHKREHLTPAIGLRFEREFQLKDVLALPEGDERREATFEELAYLISLHGVCAFPAQDLSPEDLERLALALGRASGAPADSDLHIHPTAALGEDGRPKVGTISNKADSRGARINFKDERSELASQGIHTDISFERRPARYSMLRMHTLPPTGGDTLFYSSYAHHDKLSAPMRAMLSGLRARHSGAMFREQARRHGFDLHLGPRGAPDNVDDSFEASHPVIRTNAVTGFNTLFVNQCFTERIEGVTFDESRALLDYLFKLQAQSHDAQVRYRWSEGDLCIWDNSACLHCATFDYDEERSGDRTVFVGEAPAFDAERGRSRREALASVV